MAAALRHAGRCVLALGPLGVVTGAAAADEALWTALAEGGKVVLMRHAPVDTGGDAGDPRTRDATCRAERNLSSAGRKAAQQLGQRFRDRAIPVGEVRHSPFCRTADTAELAFGTASPAPYLALLEALPGVEADAQTQALNGTIAGYRGAENLILVTHQPNISAVSFELLQHLDFLVLQPRGDDDYEELGVIRFLTSE